ncbi:MAG: carboxymuconolactone decarboxylase family protein [Phycisphaera sp.]|nr:MAG: carboxymuconolactone decarboxylase family protein [Phycisphaera sp.]
MTRLNLIEIPEANEQATELLNAVKKKLGIVPNMTKAMANAPVVLEGYLGLSGAIGSGTLSPRLREQIALLSAESNGCRYCLSAHSAIGKSVGLSQDEINNARQGEAADPREAAGLEFAKAILAERGGVSESDFDAARQAGYSDSEITEIIGNVVVNVFTNYFNRAAQPIIDFPEVEPACAC